jgi:predicted RNA-binding protein associated with RNAse of E/G family
VGVKRKRADRPEWRRITHKDFHVEYRESGPFEGYMTFLKILEVEHPLWMKNNNVDLCLADAGYVWVQHFPVNGRHTQTAMFDADGAAIQWYIDICKQYGINRNGIPWFDDLYLDIVVNPEGEFQLLDVDELEEARVKRVITMGEYELAWKEARRLLKALGENEFSLYSL